jgi:hypothetical protein
LLWYFAGQINVRSIGNKQEYIVRLDPVHVAPAYALVERLPTIYWMVLGISLPAPFQPLHRGFYVANARKQALRFLRGPLSLRVVPRRLARSYHVYARTCVVLNLQWFFGDGSPSEIGMDHLARGTSILINYARTCFLVN